MRASTERDLRQAAGSGAPLPRSQGARGARRAVRRAASYHAASGRLPSAAVLLLLAVAGFFVPDLMLRSEVKRRREAIFLDLEAIAVLALALGAGQSLRQALEPRPVTARERSARN